MSTPLHPVVRSLAGFLALLTALAVVLLALMFAVRSHPVLLLGAAGAVAATAILFRTHRSGARLGKVDVALLLLGLAAPFAAVTVVVQTSGMTLEGALKVSLKSDLRNLLSAEDAYFAKHGVYADELADLGADFRTSTGVSVSLAASGRSFQASARHERMTATCAIYVGDTAIAPATTEREPACTPE